MGCDLNAEQWLQPIGSCVEVVGLDSSLSGRSCALHDCCRKELVKLNMVVRFRLVLVVPSECCRDNISARLGTNPYCCVFTDRVEGLNEPPKEEKEVAGYVVEGGVDT